MAYRFGILVSARGKNPEQLMTAMVDSVPRGEMSVDDYRVGDGWVAVTLALADETPEAAGQLLQVTVGGKIVADFRRLAIDALGDAVRSQDAMAMFTVSDPDWSIIEPIIDYAVNDLEGVLWDSRGGFRLPD